jgi:IS1 family transposase
MNRLPLAKRVQILSMLCEGSSMRSISRVVGVSINTVTRELVVAGTACAAYHDMHVRNVKACRVQCDEIWAFNYCKERAVKTAKKPAAGAGDIWTWTALASDTKLMVSWLVSPGRDSGYAIELMDDLRSRLATRVQLSTDGHRAYLEAVEGAFGADVDYGQLVKIYGEQPEGVRGRYSPAECIGADRRRVEGSPDPAHISTSHVESHNRQMRMSMRRFTRLTNAHSKKVENHCHALALYFTWYNFARQHGSLRVSPAMAAGLINTLMSMEDIVRITDEYEAAQKSAPASN